MTAPIRETIASAALDSLPNRTVAYVDLRDLSRVVVSGSVDLLAMADAVLRALDEAGCVVRPREPDDAMVWAGCAEIVRAHGRECKRCPPLVETPYGAGTQACRLEAEDIYRAMISAHTGQDGNGADVSVSVVE